MGDGATNPTPGGTNTDPAQAAGKGKGRAEPQDVSMGEEEDSSDEETGAEDEVCTTSRMSMALYTNTSLYQAPEERKIPLPFPALDTIYNTCSSNQLLEL